MKNRKYSFKNNLTSNFKCLSFKWVKQGKLNNKKVILIKLMKLRKFVKNLHFKKNSKKYLKKKINQIKLQFLMKQFN
jgi:hypothetical protein